MTEEPIIIPEEEKGYQCEVIQDSVNPVGCRITTMRWKYPLMVHAEACRHRCFSRSVASNRAIPTRRILAMVEQDPVVPIWWGKAQSGMQAEEELNSLEQSAALASWWIAQEDVVRQVTFLMQIGVHKQITNRLLAPFQWVTEIVTATDWANFFALRCHPAAQPEMRKIAEMARDAYEASVPKQRASGQWHLPLVDDWHGDLDTVLKISAARCARTSYRTHEGKVSTPEEDLQLFDRLVGSTPKHASPTEHQAMALDNDARWGPLRGWKSHRYHLEDHTAIDFPYQRERR